MDDRQEQKTEVSSQEPEENPLQPATEDAPDPLTAGPDVSGAKLPEDELDSGESGQSDAPLETAEPQQDFDPDLFGDTSSEQPTAESSAEGKLRAVVEAIIYVTEEPLTPEQIATGLELPKERVVEILRQIEEECARPERGVSVREVAGGYKMGTKPEHHEAIRAFVKKLRPPFKLSLAALETLAVVAYKQPITSPEIMEVRGVQGAGVVKTLLDRKLIVPAGRKQVVGKPILYKTTKEFLLQFGLKDLTELPTLKEFEELRRLAFSDDDIGSGAPDTAAPPATPPPLVAQAKTEAEAESETEAALPATGSEPTSPQDQAEACGPEQNPPAPSE